MTAGMTEIPKGTFSVRSYLGFWSVLSRFSLKRFTHEVIAASLYMLTAAFWDSKRVNSAKLRII